MARKRTEVAIAVDALAHPQSAEREPEDEGRQHQLEGMRRGADTSDSMRIQMIS